LKYILIILTTFLFACNRKPKEKTQSVSIEEKVKKEVSTTPIITPFEIKKTNSTFPKWVSNLYNKTEGTEYYKNTHEIIQFNKLNDSLSSSIIISNDGICAKYFLATQLSKKEIDFIEIAEECDHEQSIPEYTWSEYKIINSRKVNTTEYNEFIPDSLLINGEIAIDKSIEDYESIKTRRCFEYKILKNGEIEKQELKQNKTVSIDTTYQEYLGDRLKPIVENNKRIKNVKEWTAIDKRALSDSTEGGVATYYFLKKNVEKIVAMHFGKTNKVVQEFYTMNEQLSFVFEKTYYYGKLITWNPTNMKENKDNLTYINENSEIIEERSYFENQILIRQINNQDCGSPSAQDYLKEEEIRLINEFEKLINRVKK